MQEADRAGSMSGSGKLPAGPSPLNRASSTRAFPAGDAGGAWRATSPGPGESEEGHMSEALRLRVQELEAEILRLKARNHQLEGQVAAYQQRDQQREREAAAYRDGGDSHSNQPLGTVSVPQAGAYGHEPHRSSGGGSGGAHHPHHAYLQHPAYQYQPVQPQHPVLGTVSVPQAGAYASPRPGAA